MRYVIRTRVFFKTKAKTKTMVRVNGCRCGDIKAGRDTKEKENPTITSAWSSPARRCHPSPTTFPAASTSTHPTIGFGRVCPLDLAASCNARCMKTESDVISAQANWDLETPQAGHVQPIGTRDQEVPGASPLFE